MLLSATVTDMGLSHDINQRDLRLRSREIMDAVERGEAFIVTRDGRRIAELLPLRARRRVPAADFIAASASAPSIDDEAFRRDLDSVAEPDLGDPYGR